MSGLGPAKAALQELSPMRMPKRISLALVALFLAACSPSFSDEDIAGAQNSIRAEYEKNKKLEVVDVALIKETSTRLTGYVEVRVKGTSIERTIDCSANMGLDGRYIWQCGK